jgi:hypothetical protein
MIFGKAVFPVLERWPFQYWKGCLSSVGKAAFPVLEKQPFQRWKSSLSSVGKAAFPVYTVSILSKIVVRASFSRWPVENWVVISSL